MYKFYFFINGLNINGLCFRVNDQIEDFNR